MFTYMADRLTFFVLWLLDIFRIHVSDRIFEVIHYFFYDTLKVFFLLIIVIFVVSIIRTFFTMDRTRKLLKKYRFNGVLGNIAGSILGIFTPFCSCSAVPLFMGFIEAGIPLGTTLSFLIASPMINEIALVMLWSLFGWKIALIYISTGLVIATISGYIIGKLRLEKYVEKSKKRLNFKSSKMDWKDRFYYAKSYTFNIVKKLWPYVIVGIAIGAIMHGWAPAGMLANYAGPDNPFAVIIAVLVGIPLYSNAAGVIPIVNELTRMGMAMGTALSFMMSVTALSLPEFILLRKVLKPRLLIIFISIVGVSIILIGYLFNAIL